MKGSSRMVAQTSFKLQLAGLNVCATKFLEEFQDAHASYRKAKDLNAYLLVDFDTGSCKTLATIAGHLQKGHDVRLPTSSKLQYGLASYGSIQNHV